MNMLKKALWLFTIIILVTGCSSLRKAELASDNPESAVAEVTQIMKAAQQDQIDVLADEQYSKGSSFLADASRGLKQGDLVELIVGNAAIAKAFFQDARKTAEPRKSSATRILRARNSALKAGVRKSNPLIVSLKEIDDDLKSETKQFSRTLSPEVFSELQKKYLALETKAVQFTELDAAKQAINQAIQDNADDLAPESLRNAQLDYKTAMNIIVQSPRSPDVYRESVDGALASATHLRDVMNVILGAKGTPENIAVQIVKQKRALGELTTSLKTTKQSLQEKEGKLKQTEGILRTQEEQLARASTQVRFQKAMDEARKVLSQDDALVYQQGNKLVFRLKRINFKSGTAVIPEASKQLIVQADSIIKKLDAEKVVVEGHTDSVGSAEVNKKLSNHRAAAVANYLFSLKGGYKITYAGYGEKYPIVSNETAEGRATNRRVDLVVSVKE